MDINENAQNSLLRTGYNVVFQYPQSFSTLPVISFYTADERATASYDNTEAFRDGVIVVDIWAKTPGECTIMGEDVRNIMTEDGWTELFSMDVPRGKDSVYHRTMRLVKSFYTGGIL